MKIREDFTKKFGYICHEMCNGGRLSYNRYVDEGSGEIKGYNIDHLTKQELYDLMKKSVETGVDHLYEAVKDKMYIFPKGCWTYEAVITDIIQNRHINSNISDLYGAVTYNKLHGGYGHKIIYWEYNNIEKYFLKLKAETIANMFEALGSNIRIGAMVDYFPSTWEYFNNMVERLF